MASHTARIDRSSTGGRLGVKLDMPHAAAGGACSLTTRRCRLLPLHARPYGRPTPAPTHRTSRRRPQSRRTAAAAPRRAAPPSCAPQQQCRSLHGQGKAGRKRGEPQAVKGSVRAPEQCKHPRLQAQRPPLAVNPPRTRPSSPAAHLRAVLRTHLRRGGGAGHCRCVLRVLSRSQ